jgi:hypothetical protein
MSSDAAREAQFFGPPTIELFLNSEWALMVSRRFNYAIFTVMIWDLILTFPKEVSLFGYGDNIWLIGGVIRSPSFGPRVLDWSSSCSYSIDMLLLWSWASTSGVGAASNGAMLWLTNRSVEWFGNRTDQFCKHN